MIGLPIYIFVYYIGLVFVIGSHCIYLYLYFQIYLEYLILEIYFFGSKVNFSQ